MAKDKKRNKALQFNKVGLKKAILAVFYENTDKYFNYKQLAAIIGAKDENSRQLINVVLLELRDSETLEEIERGKYKLKSQGGIVTGVIELNPKGYGELTCEELSKPRFYI